MPQEEKKVEKKPTKKGKSKGRVLFTHIEHHKNGSHTVKHDLAAGAEPISYAAPDMDAVKAGLDEHVAGGGVEEAEASPNPVMERLGQPTPVA